MEKPFQNYIYAKYHVLSKLLLLVLENNAGNHLRGKWQTALHRGHREIESSSNSINCFQLDPKWYRQTFVPFQAYSKK